MSLVGDIAGAYVAPRKAMQAQIERGITEPQTLFYAMLFGVMNVIASYPRIVGTTTDQNGITEAMSVLFVGNIFVLPLVLYGFATLLHGVLVNFGGQGSWAEVRRAVNWAAVVSIPLILISGASYVLNNSVLLVALNLITGAVFFLQLWFCLKQVEFK